VLDPEGEDEEGAEEAEGEVDGDGEPDEADGEGVEEWEAEVAQPAAATPRKSAKANQWTCPFMWLEPLAG
jgi:hypothetical protein